MAAEQLSSSAARPVVQLANLPRSFSFSKYLAGCDQEVGGVSSRVVIVHHGGLLDPVYCITLGLCEEGRGLKRGRFYHLPLRQDLDYGHPCDVAFIDEKWSDFDCQTWDELKWKQRLELCAAGTNISAFKQVIPICARILAYNLELQPLLNSHIAIGGQDTKGIGRVLTLSSTERPRLNDNATNTSTMLSRLSLYSATTEATSDPACRIGSSTYSRPIADVSTFLVHYHKLGTRPLVCMSGAAEDKSLCRRFPTPGDVSETFVREPDHVIVLKRRDAKKSGLKTASETAKRVERAGELVLAGKALDTVDVVQRLLAVWNEDDRSVAEDCSRFGSIKHFWIDLKERIASDKASRDISQMEFWPRN